MNPFTIDIPQADLDDLANRLTRTRWANELPVPDTTPQTGPTPPGWEYGVPVDYVRRLVAYWRDGFDWHAQAATLNAYPQFTTTIDGQNIHFLHIRGAHPTAFPLILSHGWPNSVAEFLPLIDLLTEDFHLVIPSLPGFGFSGPTAEPGWNRYRTAAAWAELMRRLGYDRYGAHGNDLGAHISPEVGRCDPEHAVAVHVTQLYSFPDAGVTSAELTADEQQYQAILTWFNDEMAGYARLQESKPQNLAHALADSPAGQLAWSAQLLSGTSDDHVLTNASIYWLTNTAASAARFYYEDHHAKHPTTPTTTPTGLASFAFDFRPLRRFAERDHANIVSWNEYDRSGHWATQDAADLLADDIRTFFQAYR
jgi:epoxide hydrolase